MSQCIFHNLYQSILARDILMYPYIDEYSHFHEYLQVIFYDFRSKRNKLQFSSVNNCQIKYVTV